MNRWMATTFAGMLCAALVSPAMADTAVGTWRMENGKITVRVGPCGDALCGVIVGMKKPLDKQGKPKVDKHNPNPSLRNRPVMGLKILNDMKGKGDDYWTGVIYNPDDGNTYSSSMKLNGGGIMKVKGCVAGILCKSMTFVKVN